jgi:putative restriction endonuclease
MFAIATTDLDWFFDLRAGATGRVVNFWTPTPWHVKGLHLGDRLYFMLKAPIRKIGGFGLFVRYSDMTAEKAWTTYGLGNGVPSREALVSKINWFATKRSKGYTPSSDPHIGCIELSDVVTLDDKGFVAPEDYGHLFANQVVKLKYFAEPDRLSPIIRTVLGLSPETKPFALVNGPAQRLLTTRKDRKGQSAFRQEVLRNYGYRCCAVGEPVVELLEAAHIQPYVDERSNHPQNGLCLRVDLHRLFDEGLLALSDDHKLQVSAKLKDTSYEELDGKLIAPPTNPEALPSPEALAAHRLSFR